MITSQETPTRVHPRPLMTRPWHELDGPWQFRFDDADQGLDAHWESGAVELDQTIVVPFPPESPASGIGDPGFHPVLWYRREFTCSARPGSRILLHFGAVDYRASVWVNGRLVAEHEGGHTPFHADITAALAESGQQTVVVRAEDQPHDLQQPRGKQDWELEAHDIWYRRTSGIWQPVWWEEVGESHVERLSWSCDVDSSRISLTTTVRRVDDRPLRLRVRLTQHGKLLVDDTYSVIGRDTHRDIVIPRGMSVGLGRLEWAPEHPHLIDATVELLDDDRIVDTVDSYTAMRSVHAGGGRFNLNGAPYFLRLVLAQGFWPESHLAAPDEGALRREVELAKACGFNGVRLHQKVEDPRFLYWCDRLGLLVWAEMPAAYEFSTRTVGRLTREWLEVVERDSSHPCVIAWVPVNESWGVPALPRSPEQQALVRSLYHLTKAVDGTRPVIGNDGWEQVVSDIVTVHDYSAGAEVLRARYGTAAATAATVSTVQPQHRSVLLDGMAFNGQPVMITEFGGISLPLAADGTIAEDAWMGYGSAPDAETLLERYRALVGALLDSAGVTGFCYTQLTDTMQERNGLLSELRVPKVPLDQLRAINCRTSAAVPADAVHEFQHGDYPVPLGDRVAQD